MLKANQPLDVAPAEVLSRTRTTYDGPLVLGEDLMRFEIDQDVAVLSARKERVNIDAAIKR